MNTIFRCTSFIVGVTTLFLIQPAIAGDIRDGQELEPLNSELRVSERAEARRNTAAHITQSPSMFVSFGQKPMVRPIEKPARLAQADLTSEVKVRARLNFLWRPETRSAIVDMSTGCLSTSTRGLRDTFSFTVDNPAKKLTIDGDFWHARGFHIGSADCMGATTRRLRIDGLVPGTYKIVRHGRIVWTLELADRAVNKRH